jgi:hypothetical protein
METLKYELEMQELITIGEQAFTDLSERFANLQVRYLRQE